MEMNIPKDRFMQFMYKDTAVCDIWYNFYTDRVSFKNHSSDWTLLPFGRREDTEILTIADLYFALEDYTFPETRYNCKEILESLGLDFFDRFEIVRKTHGAMCNTQMWIKFDDDPPELSWADVCPD